ncbi:MAG: nucleotidyltransferase domain-containing protein [Candidatus Pacearchaeota archaeon]|nr:nucleotidyltransferase domain-containing protein [Candidatus Pacearchaeota archaeon]
MKLNRESKEAEVKEISRKIKPLLKKNGVKKAGIFGSYSRGEQEEGSDIDILVDMEGSLLDVIGLEIELKKLLKKKVDLLTYNGIHPSLKKQILHEEVRVI